MTTPIMWRRSRTRWRADVYCKAIDECGWRSRRMVPRACRNGEHSGVGPCCYEPVMATPCPRCGGEVESHHAVPVDARPRRMYDQVLDFHVNKIGDPPRPPIMWMSDKRQAFRLKWLREEVNELADAYADQDMAKVADGLGDVLYVAIGTAIAHGLPIEEIVAEIHRSNMTKTMDGIGEDAKATKGLDYEPPRIAQILADHGWEES